MVKIKEKKLPLVKFFDRDLIWSFVEIFFWFLVPVTIFLLASPLAEPLFSYFVK